MTRRRALPALLILFGLFVSAALADGRGFRTQHMLEEHYAKYGSGFGSITMDQYLRMAQQLRDSRAGKNILQAKRANGSVAKFDKRRGSFVAYDPDGTLRTFFVPKNGLRFFYQQSTSTKVPD